jgi:hydrogenase maturation protein HypF
MLEAGWLDREVLGVAWDGTGYGPDGTIWGGEFLVAKAGEFRRAASLRPFVLPGGERAVHEPWRVAVSLVSQAAGAEEASRLRFDGVAASRVEQVAKLVARANAGPITSSAGRLFDGVAAVVLGVAAARFEGEPAMRLEAACEADAGGEYVFPASEGRSTLLDWRPLVCNVLADCAAGVEPGSIAMRFHRALADGIAAVARRFVELPVVLCGGCFQNKVLAELAVERLGGRPVTTPGVIPTGDGGLAAGQLAVAAARLAGGWPCA